MTQVWECIYSNCGITIKEEDTKQFYEETVKMHISEHMPTKTGRRDRSKDRADWTTMEKWPADMHPVGKMSAADFDNFEKLVNVTLNEANTSERNSSRTKTKVLGSMEALRLRGLEDLIMDGNVTTNDLLVAMRKLMVAPRNWCKDAWDACVMTQNKGEQIRNFIERKEKAVKIAGLWWKGDNLCECMDEMYKFTVIRGITNDRLKTRIFDDTEIGNAVIREAEWKEVRERLIMLDLAMDMQEDSPTTPTVNKISKSSYKKGQKMDHKKTESAPNEGKCRMCREFGHHQKDCPLRCTLEGCDTWKYHKLTKDHAVKINNMKKNGGGRRSNNWKNGASVNQVDGEESDSGSASEASVTHIQRIEGKVAHITFVKNKNQRRALHSDPSDHPELKVKYELDPEGYKAAGHEGPKVEEVSAATTRAICDTGANICLMSKKLYRKLKAPANGLVKTPTSVRIADQSSMQITETCILNIEAEIRGEKVSTVQQVYIIDDPNTPLYLSKDALINLKVISPHFPDNRSADDSVGHRNDATLATATMANDELMACKCDGVNRCPKRKKPSEIKIKNPTCEMTKENRAIIQKHLLEQFASSTFNQCENQQLPTMTGHPVRITVEDGAEPVFQKGKSVAIHLEKDVKASLDRDVNLGVIEKLPVNTPTEWCARMVITPKPNGAGIRRCVDFTGLNKVSKRQLHNCTTPFEQASKVPMNTLKTVMDAWNGYHSVPVHKKDRKYLNFHTQWGTYRYKKAPQGWCTSGDAYTRRYDDIIKDIPHCVKQIDDTMLWGDNMAEIYERTVEYLKIVGENGVILNKKKFSFGNDEVDYAGFRITNDRVLPLEKNLEALRDFPTPVNISDIRSFFALANNLNFSTKVKEMLKDFRHLLSPKKKFEWTKELHESFMEVKQKLVEQAKNGVKKFEMGRWTILETDFSKDGLGYCLKQKICKCSEEKGKIDPNCCKTGYKTILCGSRFTSSHESKYAAVEGELLALEWALDSTKHFTLQNPKLVISTDHQPLVRLIENSPIENLYLRNTRLARLKERTLRWDIRKIIYTPGKKNTTADAFSRSPIVAAMTLASIKAAQKISDDELIKETKSDRTLQGLIELIKNGFPAKKQQMPTEQASFWTVRENLSVRDNGIVMLGKRQVIPTSLVKEACKIAHAAHQSPNSMLKMCEQRIYWPNMAKSFQATRDNCNWCIRRAPSHAKLPPAEIEEPNAPMESICIDFAMIDGDRFGIMVDRYSNWPAVWSCKGTSLCHWLRKHIENFGAPRIISTDRGKEFESSEFKRMLETYNIHHRESSAYNPHSNNRVETAVKTMKRLLAPVNVR